MTTVGLSQTRTDSFRLCTVLTLPPPPFRVPGLMHKNVNCKLALDLVMEMNLAGKTFCIHNSLEYIVQLIDFSLERKLDTLVLYTCTWITTCIWKSRSTDCYFKTDVCVCTGFRRKM